MVYCLHESCPAIPEVLSINVSAILQQHLSHLSSISYYFLSYLELSVFQNCLPNHISITCTLLCCSSPTQTCNTVSTVQYQYISFCFNISIHNGLHLSNTDDAISCLTTIYKTPLDHQNGKNKGLQNYTQSKYDVQYTLSN